MKRIALFFAAIAALSSCMKENTLSPVQPVDGQVTIKAVAADTKTLLDGTAVVWEAEDAIAVVLEGTQKNMVEFTAETVADANATFVGTVAGAEFETAYAVYPKTAFDQSTYTVSHELPDAQTGVVASGMNLSSALLDADQLKSGSAEAEFHNALTLLQVVVPDGVNSVALTSSQDGLVGSTDFYVTNGVLSRKSLNTKNTVTLSTGSELAAGTYSLLVYPGNPGNLTLTMVGTDGAELIKTVSGYTFEASKYYTINLTKIFNMNVNETEYVSPAGGTFEVDVVATEEYEFSPTFTADWVSYVETKAFNGKTLVFNVEANTTGAEREANVTITWGTEGTKTFKVVQNAVFMDIVNDADGNPIQWEETFGVYANEADAKSGNNAKATYKNVFTIALSDDFSKGIYKVSNIFKVDAFYGEGFQPNYDKGGEYYAYYADGKLTLKMAGATKSYNFSNDVVLTYDESAKTFKSEGTLGFTANSLSSYKKDGVIGGYSVAVKAEGPEVPEVDSDPIAGTWNVTGGLISNNISNSPSISLIGMEMIISGSEGNYTIDKIGDTSYNLSLTLSDNTLVSNPAYKGAPVLTLIYDSEAITLTQKSDFMDYMSLPLSGLVATKQGGAVEEPAAGVTVDDLVGTTWVETFTDFSGTHTGTLTISATDNADKGQLKVNMLAYNTSSSYYLECYADLNSDGTVLTVKCNGVAYEGWGCVFSGDIVLNVENGGTTLGLDASVFMQWGNLEAYTATKQ